MAPQARRNRRSQLHNGGGARWFEERGRGSASASHVAGGGRAGHPVRTWRRLFHRGAIQAGASQQESTMASKDLRPEQRLGKGNPKRIKMLFWAIGLLACGSGLYAAYHFASATEVEIPVARARTADFIISVRTRGDIKSTRSIVVAAPQAPGLR